MSFRRDARPETSRLPVLWEARLTRSRTSGRPSFKDATLGAMLIVTHCKMTVAAAFVSGSYCTSNDVE